MHDLLASLAPPGALGTALPGPSAPQADLADRKTTAQGSRGPTAALPRADLPREHIPPPPATKKARTKDGCAVRDLPDERRLRRRPGRRERWSSVGRPR